MARSSKLPAVRAAVRLARRDAWRNRGRSALIAVMIALPVLAASTVSVVYRSDQRDAPDIVRAALGDQSAARITYTDDMHVVQSINGENYGGEGAEDSLPPRTEAQIQAVLQAGISPRDRLIPDVTWYASRAFRHEGRRITLEIREIDYTTAGLGGLIVPVSGRTPGADNEVVISESASRESKVGPGGTLTYTPVRDGPSRELTVVGVVGGTNLLGSSTVIGRPGSLIPAAAHGFGADRADISWRVVGPDPVTWDQVVALNQIGGAVASRQVILNPPADENIPSGYQTSTDTSAIGVLIVVIGLVLLQIGLLAGPAIAVGARRNQRGLAVLAATGAERRHLRLVVLATSGITGLVAALGAAVLGAGLGSVIVLLLKHYGHDSIIRVDIHPLDLLALAAVGGLTAFAAALIPAWQAARLDVIAVLTGRRNRLAAAGRIPIAGLLVAASGVALAYLFSGRHSPLPAVAALALAEVGLIAATGAVVMAAAGVAVRLPFTLRFALRDAARQRSRTVPAVAAVLAAIAGGTCALVFVASQARHDELSNSPEAPLGTVLVQLPGKLDQLTLDKVKAVVKGDLPVAELAEYRGVMDAQNAYFETVLPPKSECPFNDRLETSNVFDLSDREQRAFLADPRCTPPASAGKYFTGTGDVFDDGSAYPLLTGERDAIATAALRSGRVAISDPLLLWPDGTVHVTVVEDKADGSTGSERTVALPATLSPVSSHLAGPVYPLSAAKDLGLPIGVRGLVATTTRMPSEAEERRAQSGVLDLNDGGISVAREYDGNFGIGLLALVIAAAVVALVGTFTAVGLAAAESRADIATLAAVGASPGIRRRLAAGQAGVIAGFGSVLGLFSGLLAGWVLIRMKQPMGGSYESKWLDQTGARQWLLVLPWAHLLAIGIGIPLLAAGVGFLTTRSRLPLVRRLGQ